MDFASMAFEALPDDKSIASTDQKLKKATVLAILAIGQEVNRLNEAAAAETGTEK